MNTFSTIILTVLCCLGLTQAATAKPVDSDQSLPLADLHQAFKLQSEQKFNESYQQFYELMRLGNGRASTELGLMTLAEEGTEYDPVRAWAYFKFGGELGFVEAAALADEVYNQLSAEQQQATPDALDALRERALITQRNTRTYRQHEIDEDAPSAEWRPRLEYPSEAQDRGELGYVLARILIGTDGKVAVSEPVLSSNRTFERISMDAVSRWRFDPPTAPVATYVHLDFKMEGYDSRQPFLRAIKDVTWEQAMAGNPGYQLVQAEYLKFIAPRGMSEWVQSDLYREQPPTLDDLTVIEDDLVGEHIWPLNWTDGYWFQQAAHSGEYSAQRVLAFDHDEWEQYLIERGDARTAAWAAVRWLSQDDYPDLQNRGMEVIEHLKDSEDEVARDMAQTLSDHYTGEQNL